jgi:hypothetical protein
MVGEEEYIYGIRQVVGQIPTRFQISTIAEELCEEEEHER